MSWLAESAADMAQPLHSAQGLPVTGTASLTSSQAYTKPQFQPSETISPCSDSDKAASEISFLPASICEKIVGNKYSAPNSDGTQFTALAPVFGRQNALTSRPGAQAKQKKVGRPIAYKGDPSAPNLTEVERRRIKRRIANRESARRVRARRQETLKELQLKMDQINTHNAQMVKHIAEVEGYSALLNSQLQDCEVQWNKAITDNERLHQQVSLLNSQADEQVKQVSNKVMLPACGNPSSRKMSAGCIHLADSHCAASVTGISCDLIEELPTMALPCLEGCLMPGPCDECTFLL